MSTSPRLSKSQTASRKPQSVPMILVVTALDTTWRMFLPTIGGTFAGIGLDKWLNIAPLATIVCIILGFTLSVVLITRQLMTIRRKP